MKKAIYVILILFLQSCVTGKFELPEKQSEFKKILSDTSKPYIYRARLKIYDNEFSGLIIIKAGSETHRIVFINEVGMKFFDIELLKNTYKVHNIFEPLNKKMFVKLLVSDFRFVLMNNLQNSLRVVKVKEKEAESIAVKPDKTKEIYFFNRNTLLPESAIRYSVIRKKVFLSYQNYKNGVPGIINLKHRGIKFEIKLIFIK